ncbi:hypothetical protein GJ633_02640 [Halorubrum sp. CBA1125]|uniref:hypothetical protein n=1 Tax=Halorubrum sp. CBA1125 TaxID=2668072 RepID=UPI0012E8D9A1|nr:hypothetical protein [Halorubrum sp. CBA1125]MUW13677.1 hypothetical protein [Halorubrum sp. CBA1125]
MSTVHTVEIVSQPVNLSESDAMKQVEGRFLDRIKSTVTDVEPVRATRRYKPFYSYDVTLTKRIFRGEDDVREGNLIVDALTDIARPFTADEIEEVSTEVPEDQVLEPEVPEEQARTTANGRRMQVEHREGGNLEILGEPQLVYKPVWIVELSNDEVRVVDAVDGTVFTDMLLG